MEKIKAYWDVSVTEGFETFDINDLGCDTIQEWESLDDDTKTERIQEALDELPERVCIILDKWSKIKNK